MRAPFLKQPQEQEAISTFKGAQVSLIRNELVTLTKNHSHAVILNQLLYWSQRTRDFSLMLEEEKSTERKENEVPQHGWIYKTASELLQETMLHVDRTTARRYLNVLVKKRWLFERSNPQNKWNKTTQYRVNVQKIQKDLMALGFTLSDISLSGLEEVFLNDTENSKEKNAHSNVYALPSKVQNALSNGKIAHSIGQNPLKTTETSNGQNAHSEEQNAHSEEQNAHSNGQSPLKTAETSNEQNARSEEQNARSKVQNAHSEGQIAHSNVQNARSKTENTTKNTNKEHTQDAGAREVDQKSFVEKDFCEKTFSAEAIRIWNACLSQEGLVPSGLVPSGLVPELPPVHLTDERRRRIYSLFPLYFENDLAQWEQFCKRVANSPFLIGQGARKWRASLDWILVEENLLKVLEGNFDDGTLLDQKTEKVSEDARKNEISAILESIEDPVWKKLCSQLDFSPESHEFVSLGDLKTIANARFLEVEDDRLVWVGSDDPRVLSRIDDLRLKLSSSVKRMFPQSRSIRTRLEEKSSSLNNHSLSTQSIEQKGKHHD